MDEVWVLVLSGFLAGCVDSAAGGGGLVSVPALLNFSGLSPAAALATNKLQSSLGVVFAVFRYRKLGYVNFSDLKITVFWTALGAALGAVVLQWIDSSRLQSMVVVLLTIVWLRALWQYSQYFRQPKEALSVQSINPPASFFAVHFDKVCGTLIGFYDGFFGPGTGILWTTSFIEFRKLSIKFATAATKVVNMTSNLVSLVVFLSFGLIDLKIGLTMGLANIAGAWLGSQAVHCFSAKTIQTAFLVVSSVILATLYHKVFF